MKLCCSECDPLCDFCKHYKFNPDSEGRYVDNGYCTLRCMPQDPLGDCDGFECGMTKDDNGNR